MFSSFTSDKRLVGTSTPTKGYLAFPAGSRLTSEQKLQLDRELRLSQQGERQKRAHDEQNIKEQSQKRHDPETHREAWRDYQRREEERQRVVKERERAEALIGEKHWVRQGGMLRDANGKRDPQRTEEVRKIVEKEDKERRIIERWLAYEQGWASLSVGHVRELSFGSIPWPHVSPPRNASDLRDAQRIGEFLFESLGIMGNSTSRKERIRSSLLRWHPDKLVSIVARVKDDDVESVRDGIDAVVMGLMKLQEEEKARS
jgi:hypothetical protein